MHLAIPPFYLASQVGLRRPPEISGKLEKKVTDKAQIVKYLKKGFAPARRAVHFVSDADLDTRKRNTYTGTQMSKRAYLMGLAVHGASHLGQLGIYARQSGIVPPWIIEENKRRAVPKKKAKTGAGEKKVEKTSTSR